MFARWALKRTKTAYIATRRHTATLALLLEYAGPRKSRSTGRYRNSMYTVCGQAHPHQIRPRIAVTRKTVTKMLTTSRAKGNVSVGRNVLPKSVKCRVGMSSSTRGLPPMRRYGIAVKTRISPHAVAWRALRKRPALGLGLSQRRVPSSFSVERTLVASLA